KNFHFSHIFLGRIPLIVFIAPSSYFALMVCFKMIRLRVTSLASIQ
ncbi:MAG: hypothetical protein ACI9EW_003500, partial [Cellvibrionaceae bacterium]